MSDLAEDRVFDGRAGADRAAVATADGVAVVAVAGGRVGRVHLGFRGDARDVAARGELVAVATDEDVRVARLGPDAAGDDADFVATGLGPASAVGFDGEALVAATDPDSEIGRVLHPANDPTDWLTVADVDAPVRAIDGPFVAAADGVYQLGPDAIREVGLDDARDVAAAASPLVAAGDGLYRLGNGWLRDREGAFDVVAARADGRAIAAGEAGVVGRRAGADGDAWEPRELPARPAAVVVGQTDYGVAADGTFMAAEDGGWRTRALGLADVRAMAVERVDA